MQRTIDDKYLSRLTPGEVPISFVSLLRDIECGAHEGRSGPGQPGEVTSTFASLAPDYCSVIGPCVDTYRHESFLCAPAREVCIVHTAPHTEANQPSETAFTGR